MYTVCFSQTGDQRGSWQTSSFIDIFISNLKQRICFNLQSLLLDDVVYNQALGGATMDKRRDLRDELGYIAPPNRKV